jgi:hypothetical protein
MGDRVPRAWRIAGLRRRRAAASLVGAIARRRVIQTGPAILWHERDSYSTHALEAVRCCVVRKRGVSLEAKRIIPRARRRGGYTSFQSDLRGGSPSTTPPITTLKFCGATWISSGNGRRWFTTSPISW